MNRTIVQHRFATNPSRDTHRKILRIDRFYIHVYQTKIGPERRTLKSKEIARELARRFGRMYWPRDIDKPGSERRKADLNYRVKERESGIRMRDVNRPSARMSWGTRQNLMKRRTARLKPDARRWEKGRRERREDRSNTNTVNSNWRGQGQQRDRRSQRLEISEEGRSFQEITCQLRRLTSLLEGKVRGGWDL